MSTTSVLIHTADHNVVLLGPNNGDHVDEEPALLSSSAAAPAAPPAPYVLTHLRTLLQQLDAIGWDRATLSADLTFVTLLLVDAGGRQHSAAVHLPPGFPIAPPTVALPLPTPFKLRWLPGDSLTTLASQLEKTLDAFQLLWEQLEDLDSHTQLLDPAAALAKPYSHCSRCIALGNGASCQLKLSPAAPRALPSSVVFHGPSSVVAALQNSWYSSAHKLWQEAQSVRENLQAVLQVSLPAPKPGAPKGCAAVLAAAGGLQHQEGTTSSQVEAGQDSDSSMDQDEEEGEPGACAICYALHLPDPLRPDEIGAAPSVTCPAALCGRAFHAACLAEWLGALPSSRRVFDTIFGCCPFCQGPIGVSTRVAAS